MNVVPWSAGSSSSVHRDAARLGHESVVPGEIDGNDGNGRSSRLRLDSVVADDTVLSDPGRLASLERTRLLDSPPDEAFDRLTRLAARILRVPVSLVTFVDEKRQFFKSAVGLTSVLAVSRGTPLSHSYCRHVVESGSPVVAKDAREHPLLRGNPAIEEYDAISYCGVPICDPDGQTLGTLCVLDTEPRVWSDDEVAALTDLAASASAEVRLRFLADDLAATNSALRDMIATTSHDVRNPLSVILGFSGLLGEETDVSADERRELAGFIHEAAAQANRLVGDLLEVSKLEAGAVEPRTANVHLSSAIEAARQQCRSFTAGVTNPAPDNLNVSVDPDHLHRILINLIANAAKYGAPPISVNAEQVGDRILITVADCGAGVAPDFVPRLFDKFARSDDAKVLRPDGAGLGLTIVAGLARKNRGSVRYEPNDPTGSRFIVELPSASMS